MNKPLTPEEAKQLTFPCLLEVWDFKNRSGHHALISHITQKGHFVTPTDAHWHNAALPSPEIAEAMRKQFGTQSEFPKRMLVWDNDESMAAQRIVLADLGEKVKYPYVCLCASSEEEYNTGGGARTTWFKNAKPIPQPDPIAQEIAELRQRLADLEAKHNQQSK
jgi:hypothetical protein